MAAVDGIHGLRWLWMGADPRVAPDSDSDRSLRERTELSVLRGDAGETVRLLETRRERRLLGSAVTDLRVGPFCDPIRSDPSFVAFMERLYRL